MKPKTKEIVTYTIGSCPLSCQIDYDRRKNCYICIKEGKLILRVPYTMTQKQIQELLQLKRDWIKNKIDQNQLDGKTVRYAPGECFPYLGRLLPIEIAYSTKSGASIAGNKIILLFPRKVQATGANEEAIHSALDTFYKNQAKNYLPGRMEVFTALTGLKPDKLTIRKASSRWGSCNGKRTISINQNLMKYPPEAIDYVLLHELCHLKYLHHQKPFWDCVKSYMPDYKEHAALLKKFIF